MLQKKKIKYELNINTVVYTPACNLLPFCNACPDIQKKSGVKK